MIKTAINQRFINCVNYLIDNDIFSKKGDIAKKINIKNAKFSEILNLRMNVGIEEIIAICQIYSFNLDYIITGKGEMIKSNGLNQLAEPKEDYIKVSPVNILDAKEELILSQKETILLQKTEILRLKNDLAECLEHKKKYSKTAK